MCVYWEVFSKKVETGRRVIGSEAAQGAELGRANAL